MPRTTSREAFQCVEPFAVVRNGVPEVYGADRLVLAGDPILRSHPSHFRPVADRVEQATAAPGEVRPIVIPDQEESPDAQE